MKTRNIDFFFHIYYYHKFKKMKDDDEFPRTIANVDNNRGTFIFLSFEAT
jgi:hypothetical protein